MQINSAQELMNSLRQEVEQVMVLRDPHILDLMMTAVLCRGHILLDDIPGVGKTMLAKSFAGAFGLDFKRIQFTPDLLPSDITGLNVFHQQQGEFQFKAGPVFTNILLSDEINRATPRTQASLLECMQEATVTIDGITHTLADPFLVLATENPIEMEGTFPLPEAQLDRFLFCLNLGYPDADGEKKIVRRFLNADPLKAIRPVAQAQDVFTLRKQAESVRLSQAVLDYLVAICTATREHSAVRLGVSPRGTLNFAKAVQAFALLQGRAFVLPDDVQLLAKAVLAHRVIMDIRSSLYEISHQQLIKEILETIPVPLGSFQ